MRHAPAIALASLLAAVAGTTIALPGCVHALRGPCLDAREETDRRVDTVIRAQALGELSPGEATTVLAALAMVYRRSGHPGHPCEEIR